MGTQEGRVALVTGGGQGIGQGIAWALAAEGADVAVAGRTASTLEESCKEIERRGRRAEAIVCDVTDPAQIDACVRQTAERLGRLDVLINNAASYPLGPLLELEDEALALGWETGPLAVLRFMKRCHPHLRGGGVVVNVGSSASSTPEPRGLGGYAAVKAAVLSLTRAAAVEWAGDGIRVNAILPAAWNPMLRKQAEANPEAFRQSQKRLPLGRLGEPEADIGRAVVFLCGPDSGYITGETLAVNGGFSYLR
jgi:meso-butanediol dehydrogenase / (S,S)-butanediol dehydrogenase / diacetyl reductase